MKKIFAISLIAMTAVTSARADIASQAYVDKQTGTLTNLTTSAQGNLVAAINEVDADVAILNLTDPEAQGYANSVAGKIATALQNANAGNAVQSVTANADAGVVTNISKNGTAIEMTKAKVSGSDIAADAAIAATQLASDVQTSLGKADTALQSSDVDQTYSATSANAQSGKAVAEAVSAVSTTADGLNTRLTTAEGKITTAEGDIDALEALVGNTAVATQISTATSDMETQTHAAATYQTLDNLATSTSWSTDKSSDTKYASAKAVDAAITAAGYDDTALAGRVTANETAIAGLGDLATKNTIANADVADNAAIAMSKIAMPLTTGTDGTYVLTGTISGDTITYKWENIARGN